MRASLKATLLSKVLRAYSRLYRIEFIHEPKSEAHPHIYAHWHGDELVLVNAFAGRKMGVLSSLSKDGEIMAQVLEKLDYQVMRGSSSKGGAAGLKALIDKVNQDRCDAALAVDGPRGPRYKVKPGILKLAQLTTGFLIPGVSVASRSWVFKKTWNQCYLPKPFSKVIVLYGSRIDVPFEASEEKLEEIRLELEKNLLDLKSRAELLLFPKIATSALQASSQ